MSPVRAGWSIRDISLTAHEQDNAIGWAQLRELGVSEAAISEMTARDLLHVQFPRTYSYGDRQLSRRGWWWAALLCCGPSSTLLDRTAAAIYGGLPVVSALHVATTGRLGEEVRGLRTRRLGLHPSEIDEHHGLRVTSVARTALDIAARQPGDRLGDFLDTMVRERLYDHREMLALLELRRGCRGIRPLRAAVAVLEDHPDTFRSRPERLARDALLGIGSPRPRVNAWFPTRVGHGYELDLFFADLRLDIEIEIDGPHHEMPHQQLRDRRRDEDLRSFGIEVARFPTWLVEEQPEAFARRGMAAIASAAGRARATRVLSPSVA